MAEPSPEIADAALRYLPHRPPAMLIRKILEADEETMVCVARFPGENALCRNGRAASHLIVEPAAQAAATHLALLAVNRGHKIHRLEGFLAGARNVVTTRPHVPAEADLRIRVYRRGSLRAVKPGLHRYRFEAECGSDIVAKGELSSYVVPVLDGD